MERWTARARQADIEARSANRDHGDPREVKSLHLIGDPRGEGRHKADRWRQCDGQETRQVGEQWVTPTDARNTGPRTRTGPGQRAKNRVKDRVKDRADQIGRRT